MLNIKCLENEALLIKKSQAGDGEAFGELVRHYEKFVYNTAYGFLTNPDDAFDVSQEAFIKAWRSIEGFREKSLFSTWLYRITVNTAKDALEKRSRLRLEMSSTDEEGETLDLPDVSTPESDFIKKETSEELYRAINSLDDTAREFIILRDVNSLTYEEISALTETEIGTVKSRINRAREKLKEKLREQNKAFEVK